MSGPKRSLGQNFLVDPNLQRKIVRLLAAGPRDEVLEIGPGREALTRHLEGRVGRLVLVELDDEMAAALEEKYAGRPDVEVIHGDILEVDLSEVSRDPGELRVVGNIPYNLTAPIVFKLLERPRPAEILVMVQREVADRIVAEAGSRSYGALAVGVRSVAEAEKVLDVPRTAFRPRPRVDSAVVRLVPRTPPPLSPDDEERLRTLTRAAFQMRRKQFQKILRSHPAYGLSHEEVEAVEAATGFVLRKRPERFSPMDLLELARALEEVR